MSELSYQLALRIQKRVTQFLEAERRLEAARSVHEVQEAAEHYLNAWRGVSGFLSGTERLLAAERTLSELDTRTKRGGDSMIEANETQDESQSESQTDGGGNGESDGGDEGGSE